MEEKKIVNDKENTENKCNSRYTASEDKAIVDYMITDNRYLKSSGIQVWKDAEKLDICPGRPYLSMKERFRKVIVRNLKHYNVEKDVAVKITQFMRANKTGRTVAGEKRKVMVDPGLCPSEGGPSLTMDLLKFIPPIKHDYYKTLRTN